MLRARASSLAVFLILALAAGAYAEPRRRPAHPVKPPASSHRVPLIDLMGQTYFGFSGGLYPGGNLMPAAHLQEGIELARRVEPLDIEGRPAASGVYILLSVGMSNTAREFCGPSPDGRTCGENSFAGRAALDPEVERQRLVILNGAKGSEAAQDWIRNEDNFDRVREEILGRNGFSEKQVQIIWLKTANRDSASRPPLPSAEADAYELLSNLGKTVRIFRARYPNLRQVFVSSRIYGGHASRTSNSPEPYAYESGFSVKWLIEAQIDQTEGRGVNRHAGDLDFDTAAPWLAWGPYLWADATEPRSDGLVWQRSDFAPDGVHPSPSGQQKVAAMMLDFFKTSTHTRCWFLAGERCP